MRCLDQAKASGASYADVRVLRQRTEEIVVKNGRVEGLLWFKSRRASECVPSPMGPGVSPAATGWTSAEADRIAALAVRTARASALAKQREVHLGPPVISVGRYETPVAIDPFQVSLEDKIALLMQADQAMRDMQGNRCGREQSRMHRASISCSPAPRDSLVEQRLVETGGGIEATAVRDGEVQKRSYPNSFGRHQGTGGYEFSRG